MIPGCKAFVRSKIRLRYLLAALAAALAGFALLLATKSAGPYPAYDTQLRAARRMALAESVLKTALVGEGIGIEADLDPNSTGLIGPEWTALTTTLGNLEAKRSTLNPNFAALLVRWFHEAGLRPGDTVAIGASGSFPGLVIATLCAAEEMGLAPIAIASFGSSMYGATRPEFTVPRMMRILSDSGIVRESLIAVSPGGDQDHGESALYDDARATIAELARASGVEYIDCDPPDIAESIARRLRLYDEGAQGGRIKCFVNIGGASPNSGTSAYTLQFPQGLVLKPPRIPSSADRGLVYEFASRGIPVINLLNVRLLAGRNGLPYDPIPLPRAGDGDVYMIVRYRAFIVFVTVAVSIGLLAMGTLRDRNRPSADSDPA